MHENVDCQVNHIKDSSKELETSNMITEKRKRSIKKMVEEAGGGDAICCNNDEELQYASTVLTGKNTISESQEMRKFDTGATRNVDVNKLDFEGFLSPAVLIRYSEYLNKHRVQADGKLRDSDNWQRGIPREVYMKSAFRHFVDVWSAHRGNKNVDLQESLCAVVFNIMGYLFEALKAAQLSEPKCDSAGRSLPVAKAVKK
jgi:uncharacterized protein YfbU (UPF0304 family)